MAKLVLTDEEQKLPFIAWDDASIGRLVKRLAAQVVTDDEHDHMLYQVSAAMILIGLADECNADIMSIELNNITDGSGKVLGDWNVSINLLEEDRPKEKRSIKDMEPGTSIVFPRNKKEAKKFIDNVDKLTSLEIVYAASNRKKKKA